MGILMNIHLEWVMPITSLPFVFMLSNILKIIMIDALSSLNSLKFFFIWNLGDQTQM